MDRRVSSRHPSRGITMLELLVVLTVMGLLAVIGLPAFLNTVRKGKMQTTIRETTTMLRAARLQAIKESQPIGIERQKSQRRIIAYEENDGTDGFGVGGTDEIIESVILPNRITFAAPGTQSEVDGFDNNDWFVYEPNGSATHSGAFRFGDPRGNYLEVRVEPAATGRVDVRMWQNFGGTDKWMSQGQEDHSWDWN
ncbi:MAG: GspH/FimT family pseudopilin [Thermoanaerobaculia bacterium]|nr:GspH/FimT family pseudopilin [Thermoanaerobaculia bacterium]